MSRLVLLIARPKHVLLALAAVLALLFALTLVPSGPPEAWASESTCSPPQPHETGLYFDETITTLDGLEREYILTVPSSYDGGAATPLLFNFHGLGSAAIEQYVYSELPQTAEAEGFILVTPQGTLNTSGIRFWNSSQSQPDAVDDVAFVDQLLTSLQSQLCIDAARVFSTGLSNGGFMSSRLACNLAGRIAAVAPVAGTAFYGSCDARPVPVTAFHGTADTIVSLASAEAVGVPGWATHNNCGAPVTQNPVPPTVGVRLTRYAGCDDGATVELYVIFDVDTGTVGDQGGGHTWPGSTFVLPPDTKLLLGQTTQEISANDLMWDFFMANPLPDDADGDGCTNATEVLDDETLGGLRDPKNPWDFYDVLGPGASLPKDKVIDLPNDILGVIQHFAPSGAPPYDVQFDRGPQIGANVWNMSAPDGVIDLPNDILGVIKQYNHSCQ